MSFLNVMTKVATSLGMAIVVLGCASLTPSEEPVGFFYLDTEVSAPIYNDASLSIANLSLKPWSLAVPTCEACEATVQTIVRPSGPSKIVMLSQNKHVVWAFIDARQTNLKTPIGSIEVQEGSLTFTGNNLTLTQLKPGQTEAVQNCSMHYVWKNAPYPEVAGVSNENPTVHAQLLYNCL